MDTARSTAVASHLGWLRCSYSGAEGGDCVEVAADAGTVRIRDSTSATGPAVRVSREAWAGFVGKA
ncbi:DUF397 domain-containing protein [Streptomyces sp. V3I8]|uniref:DUF397 domain-containing protein n=1 Tax=Streptomyces sp. V3I8 TaxID=3042279 RepID=UPI0027D84D18|nr:DUF397 domain-containing protein [Streptomyces sp. V3I8]